MATPSKFYGDLADQYDVMTRSAARRERELPIVRTLIEKFSIGKSLDAACGTGLHALLLAEQGVTVTAADLSEDMLARAREQLGDRDLPISFVCSSFADLPHKVPADHDTVLCLGNSLPHVLTPDALHASLRGFAAALRPGGTIIIQILNYEKILRERERIVGAHRIGSTEFIRFYDFLEGRVRFNILRLDWDGENCRKQLSSTELHPYVQEELKPALEEAGLGSVTFYDDLELSPFASDSSSNLVAIATLE